MVERRRAFRGDRLREARIERGLTQAELAEHIQSSKTQVIRYESGETDPGADLLLRLVTELNVSSDWLIGVLGASKSPSERPPEVSAVEMELIGALRDKDLERVLRMVMRTIDARSLSDAEASAPNDSDESA